ncbi:MAG TPA: transglycosylase SLT domain-containing protein [Candidatus Binataceae bacterium]|nr:transglycosylase SLT domain-containing protein [Candidatus Binataceae bacterium]
MDGIWLRRARWTILVAVVLYGCAGAVARSSAARAEPSPVPGATPAAEVSALPPDNASADTRQAFAEGYRAYQSHDYDGAQTKLTYAAKNFPALADYALFYLGSAERDRGDLSGAAESFERLRNLYPESVLTPTGELELARALLKLGRAPEAAAVAAHLATQSTGSPLEQNARLVQAQAMAATGDQHDAYAQAMELRNLYPRGRADAAARALAYAMLAAAPALAPSATVEYHRSEAALLLREGQASLAMDQIERALGAGPTDAVRAELLWLKAQASRGELALEQRALLGYLALAPRGPSAAAVLNALAILYWRQDDTARAGATFERIVAGFPASIHAPGAMLRIGRIDEELHSYDAARAEYARLYGRYPSSESAAEARFRAPWTYYMTARYTSAAKLFAAMRIHAHGVSERDMFDYWHARALEKSGAGAAARAIYLHLASSIDSNYYPALAARRVAASEPEPPAASAPDPYFPGVPASNSALVRFHLSRVMALRTVGIKELEAGELRALAGESAGDPNLRSFVLAGLISADAWHDAIVAAARMEKHGHLAPAEAERIRYPRAYWSLFNSAAHERSLDPWLVLALARQESLFDPRARSVSDAQGLMQLLPSTARRVAVLSGIGIGGGLDLYDPAVNVALGTTYLRSLLTMFSADEFKAVAAYNGGEHAVQSWTRKFPGADDEWVENIGYRETRDYVKKVIGGRREYLLLYERRSGGSVPRAASDWPR